MAAISVHEVASDTFEVVVDEDGSSTTHTVTVTGDLVAELGGGADAATVVAASPRFLLDREPKESIMRRFDLAVIGRFFPEYREVLGDYLGHD